jgi:hypothetical protein
MTGMRLRKNVLACVVIGLAVRSGSAAAQDARTYVGGSLMFSTQGSSTPPNEPDLAKPGVGGSAVGIVGTVGGVLSPRLSVAAELSVPRRFEVVQELRYSFSSLTDNRHRDLLVSGLLHVHAPGEHAVVPELVIGLSYVREDTLQRTAFQPGFPPGSGYGPFGRETSVIRGTLGLTVGADVAIRINSHVGIVPQARLHWIPREDLSTSGSSSALLYLAPFVFRASIGLRATF